MCVCTHENTDSYMLTCRQADTYRLTHTHIYTHTRIHTIWPR